ncbi:hypothetical protein QUA41_26925 [Microcoleus sp. Pol11C1]
MNNNKQQTHFLISQITNFYLTFFDNQVTVFCKRLSNCDRPQVATS